MPTPHYANVRGHRMFYREAGDKESPTIVQLHGFPSSSHMHRNLISLPAEKFHVIAPDYIGFGYSNAPSVKDFRVHLRQHGGLRRRVSVQHSKGGVELDRYGALCARGFRGIHRAKDYQHLRLILRQQHTSIHSTEQNRGESSCMHSGMRQL